MYCIEEAGNKEEMSSYLGELSSGRSQRGVANSIPTKIYISKDAQNKEMEHIKFSVFLIALFDKRVYITRIHVFA